MVFTSLLEYMVSQCRRMFYLVTPSETSFPSLDAIPPIVDEAVPWFLVLIILEAVYSWKIGRTDAYGLNDSITSLGAGFFLMNMTVAFRAAEMSLYIWVHGNWCIYRMPWDHAWTWFVSLLAVDFAYYWFHRASHEINIMWALHQMHHSSEYFNLTTALRQDLFQQFASIFFYIPEAFFIPPQIHITHTIFSLLYQFWIHTQVIGTLGPLERIINTPSSHRVHHGRNRYCIDKNYAAVFIIWDRIFGTYQPELISEPIFYGLVNPVNSFDALYCQLFYLEYALWGKPRAVKGFGNKFKAIFFGPAWHPGQARTGTLDEIPDIDYSVKPYNTSVTPWTSVYVLVHEILLLCGYQLVSAKLVELPWNNRLLFTAYMVFSIQALSYLLEKKNFAPFTEMLRCLFLYAFCCPLIREVSDLAFITSRIILMASASLWIPVVITIISASITRKAMKF